MKVFTWLLIACLFFTFGSCKKNTDSIDLTPSFYFLNGDTTASALNNTLILFSSSDTIQYNAIISSTYLLSKDVTIQVAADDNARNIYNSSHSTAYEAMPSNAYNFVTSITTEKDSGSIYDTIIVTINKTALDPTKSYMLPITITNGGGIDITPDASTVYLHTVNSTLSGLYNSIGTKIMYNGDADDGDIAERDTFSVEKNLVPVNSVRSQIDYADLGSNGWKYNLAFSAVTNDLLVTPNEVITSSVQTGSFKILSSSYNSSTKDIYIKSSYKNTSGNERVVEETIKLK